MSIWKKIIKAIKDSPITKGVSINKISKMAGKTKNISNDFLKLIKTKDWKGFGRGQGAKILTEKLKKGSKIFGKKIADNAKQIFNQKIAPDKKQILQTFDKATQSAKNNIKLSKQTIDKFNKLNPRMQGLKVYQSLKQKINNAKQQANKFPNFFKNLGSSTINTLNKAAYNFKVGSKSYYRGLLKFLAAGIFIYGIAISIPRQVRKYFIKKQQIQFQKQKLNHHQRMYGTAETKTNPKKINNKNKKQQIEYPSKQQVLGRNNSSSYDQAFDYRKIRERQMAKRQNYEY